MLKYILLQATIFLTLSVMADYGSYSFGKITREELEMTHCPIDSLASAAILYHYGHYNGMTHIFTSFIRIKVFTDEGKDFGTHEFVRSGKVNIKGITYNLENGEIIRERLKKSDIITEVLYDDVVSHKVVMPHVKAGTVLDIEVSYQAFPGNWFFQHEIPTMHSEILVEDLSDFNLRKKYFGTELVRYKGVNNWVSTDIPAFKPEPYINSSDNYITKFEFDLLLINGSKTINITSEWKDVSKHLMKSLWFGQLLRDKSDVIAKWATGIDSLHLDEESRIKAALDSIHTINFDGRQRLYSTYSHLDMQNEEKAGSSADLNLGLIQLLTKLNFEVYPVALSTRANGMIYTDSPSISKLNYVVAMVRVNNEFVLVDATEKYLPYNLLPFRCLNERGRLISKDTIAEIPLEPQARHKKVTVYDLMMDKDLKLTGNLTQVYFDYAAFEKRVEYFDKDNRDEYFEDKFDESVEITNTNVQDADDIYKPFTESMDVSISNEVIDGGDMIYIPLMLTERMLSNPFNQAERLYPIDFGWPIEKSGTITYIIPEDMEIVETPKSISIGTPDRSIDFIYNATVLGNKIILNYRYRVNKPQISVDEYEYIRRIYELIIEKQSEPLILRFTS